MAHELVCKDKDSPDETRPFKDGKGKLDVFILCDATVGRGQYEPGWRWSQHVKPNVGTPSCEATHTGYVLEGRMVVKMDNGSETEYAPRGLFLHASGTRRLGRRRQALCIARFHGRCEVREEDLTVTPSKLVTVRSSRNNCISCLALRGQILKLSGRPAVRELDGETRRRTHVQVRGGVPVRV